MKPLKITLLVLFSALILTSCQQQPKVYICTGSQSERYHRTNTCIGLENCSKQIIKVTKDDATNKHKRTPCRICYQ